MSEIKHTPGPWFPVFNDHYWEVRTEAGNHEGEPIGDACASGFHDDQKNNPVAEINARLMAAAPELLEAVQAMIEWDDRENDFSVDFNARMALCQIAFDKARSALAKVTGSQS